MTDTPKPPEIPSENMIHIKTLFSRLTEIILSTALSRKAVADAMCAVGQWCGLMYASLLVMIEQNPTESGLRADQITLALNKEIRRHMIILRGIKKGKSKDKSRIILPKGTTRE